MEITVDKYGRIVIPKDVRVRLGLEAGSALELSVETRNDGTEQATLQPVHQRSAFRRKGRLLVHTGRLADASFDLGEHLRRERSERAKKHAGL